MVIKDGKIASGQTQASIRDMTHKVRAAVAKESPRTRNNSEFAQKIKSYTDKRFNKLGKKRGNSVQELINLTIGMNINNGGTSNDTYGSESLGPGYGY